MTTLEKIKESLKLKGYTSGEICTELVKLESKTEDGLMYYLQGLETEE